jgi:uncharacterized protein YdhG (YjbR/CyaY superfamily)
MKKPINVDDYISGFPKETQELLEQVRATIQKAAPEAEEVISYQMPAYKQNGMLVWFGGHTNHIGLYPRVSGMEAFKKELSVYKSSKGAVQFPLDRPMPLGLITKIVKFRLKENLEEKKEKRK